MTRQLGQFLIENDKIDNAVLSEALETARQKGIRLGECLISHYGVSEEITFNALASLFDIPFITEIKSKIDLKLLSEFPREIFSENRCYPLYTKNDTLTVVTSDPLDFDILLDFERVSQKKIEINLTTPSEMEEIWQSLFVRDPLFKDDIDQLCLDFEQQIRNVQSDSALSQAEILRRVESEPVVKFVNLIIDSAVAQGASDIHIEPAELQAVVRLRINGMLMHHMDMKPWIFTPVTSRIKILANLDIAEKRLPQDGRIAFDSRGEKYDLRISTLPTQYGEKTVMRILRHDQSLLDIEKIGLPPDELSILSEMIEKPQGMILVTGPTGSGKSTVLFACLNKIKKKSINITTIENPIEYKVSGINQVQINEKAGMTFANFLRSILRQDPDVILVGETRDPETARIALQAAQTGHLVFSTLHTNDAISAITRLRDLGVPPFLISSSLLLVLAQRLIRKLCPKCKHKEPLTERLRLLVINIYGETSVPEYVYKPTGCKYCNKTGYSGRTGIYELAALNDNIRNLIVQEANEAELRKAFMENGMRAMATHGLDLIRQGITSPEELFRIAAVETE
jgi:type IV pilus assembly protein PilB